MLSATKQAISIKLATAVGHFLRDLDFAKVWLDQLFLCVCVVERVTQCDGSNNDENDLRL